MLTIDDIRDSRYPSGFRYVRLDHGGSTRPKPYRAQRRIASGDGQGVKWFGPRRATPEEAAQDYCDYVNGSATPAPLPSYADVKIDMGDVKRRAPRVEKVKVEREEWVGPTDLYDVLIVTADGDLVCRKVGITAVGTARYADICKTWGCSIKPFQDAITYPSKKDAKDAEDARIAEVCSDVKWRRIGKESFAPIKPAPVAQAA